MRVLNFGDSLTWGAVPEPLGPPVHRYSDEDHWTGILSEALGRDYEILTAGLRSRTTSVDDPLAPGVNGLTHLPTELRSHSPVDFVVLMLGTNDAKQHLGRSPEDISFGMNRLVRCALDWDNYGLGHPKVLVVAPPPLGACPDPLFRHLFRGAADKIARLPALYSDMSKSYGVDFIAAGEAVQAVGVDGVHLSLQNNLDLAMMFAAKIRSIAE